MLMGSPNQVVDELELIVLICDLRGGLTVARHMRRQSMMLHSDNNGLNLPRRGGKSSERVRSWWRLSRGPAWMKPQHGQSTGPSLMVERDDRYPELSAEPT